MIALGKENNMGVKALDGSYNFYELLQDIPGIDAGAIFYWDKEDDIHGSLAEGCLKLCWTKNGGCYSGKGNCGLTGDAIIFHASVRENSKWFKLVQEYVEDIDDTPQELSIEEIEHMLGYKVKIVSK